MVDAVKLENILQMDQWIFPEIGQDSHDDGELSANADGAARAPAVDPAVVAAIEARRREMDEIQKEKEELQLLRQECEAKIEILNHLLNKLKNPMSIIDEELIELIQDIIRKIAKKIICKEIISDKSLMLNMINELKGLIDAKNGIINIYMSEEDFSRLDSGKNNLSGLTNVDPALGTGDIVIKSNFAEIRAVLNERIEQLIRIQHE